MRRRALVESYGSALTLALGAGIYALVEGPGGATFYLTPAFFGITAVAAGMLGSFRSLVGSGMSLIGWGVAVLFVHYNAIPSARTAPAYMLGITVGVLASRAVAPPDQRVEWMTAAGLSAAFGSAGYLLAFSVSGVGRWPAWCITVVVWAVYVAVVSNRRPRAGGLLRK